MNYSRKGPEVMNAMLELCGGNLDKSSSTVVRKMEVFLAVLAGLPLLISRARRVTFEYF